MKPVQSHPRFIDMNGRRFGRLTVVDIAGRQGTQNFLYWRCRCECGNVRDVLGTSLRAGLTKSCGCKMGASKRGLTGKLTHEKLCEVLRYNPKTGIFRWRISPAIGVKPGSVAGAVHDGYVIIQIGSRKYRAHRLAYFYMKGHWPAHMVDHRDRDRANNRWTNIRPANRSQNGGNSRARRAGLKGAYFDKTSGRWMSVISVDGTRHHLGYFSTEALAHAAYAEAARRLRGEFARAA